MLCNALVCIAVWLCYSARSTTDKILAIIPPIAAFVACGFEHSVANMYFIPYGIARGLRRRVLVAAGRHAPDVPGPHVERLRHGQPHPVTIGNILGGALMVGAIYWFVYLRPRDETS